MPQQITDSNVQLPGGTQTGPFVRTLQLTVLDSGVPTTVQVQVIAIADENGNPLGLIEFSDFYRDMLDELRAIRLGMQHLVTDGTSPKFDLLDDARNLSLPDVDIGP